MRTTSVGFLVLLLSLSSFADRPSLPSSCVDKDLFGGKTPRQFFADRSSDAACTADLKAAREAVQAAQKKLADLIANSGSKNDINTAEDHVDEKRAELRRYMLKCGNCVAKETQSSQVKNAKGRTEYWYSTDGSCQLEQNDPAALKQAFDQMTDFLLSPKKYPRHKQGLGHVLEVLSYTEDGKPLDVDKISASPNWFVFSVKGEVFGLVAAFNYFLEGKFAFTPADKPTEFVFGFSTPPASVGPDHPEPPEARPRLIDGRRRPKVDLVRASGDRKSIANAWLDLVMGKWCITTDGYIRYSTAGDFLAPSRFAENQARDILMDTLTEVTEKGTHGL